MLPRPSKPAPFIDAGSYITPLNRPGAEAARKRRQKGANCGNKRLQAKAQAFHFMGGPEPATAQQSSQSGISSQISSFPKHVLPINSHPNIDRSRGQAEMRSPQQQPQLGTSNGGSGHAICSLPQLSPSIQQSTQQMGHSSNVSPQSARESRENDQCCHTSEGHRSMHDTIATTEFDDQERTECTIVAGIGAKMEHLHGKTDDTSSNEDDSIDPCPSGTAVQDGLEAGVNLVPPILTPTGAVVEVVKSDASVSNAVEANAVHRRDGTATDNGAQRHPSVSTVVTCCGGSHSRPFSTSATMDRGRSPPAPRTRFFDLARHLPRASEGHGVTGDAVDERAIVHFLRACEQRSVMPQPSLLSIPHSDNVTYCCGDRVLSTRLHIDLKGFSAADHHAHVLAAALATAPEAVTVLRLPNNRLTESGALALLKALQRNRIATKTPNLPGICASASQPNSGAPSNLPGVVDGPPLSLAAIDLSNDGASGCARLGRRMLLDGLLPLIVGSAHIVQGKKMRKAKSSKKLRDRVQALSARPLHPSPPPPPLKELVLAGAAVGAASLLQPLSGALQQRMPSLLHLDLSRCGISGKGAELLGRAFAPALRQKDNGHDEEERGLSASDGLGATLRSLVLAWNEISGNGARKLLLSLRRYARALKHLDLAWNSIGSSQPDSKCSTTTMGVVQAAVAPDPRTTTRRRDLALHTNSSVKALCALLKPSSTQGGAGDAAASVCSLLHIDLRGNALDVHACESVRRALLDNHTLMGIHLGAGNHGANAPVAVDGLGFVQPTFGRAAAQTKDFATLRMGISVVGSSKQQDDLAQSTDNCWICGGWQERRFEWRPPQGDFECVDWEDSNSESGSESDSTSVQVAAKKQPESSASKMSGQTENDHSSAARTLINISKCQDPGHSAKQSGFLRVSTRLVVEANKAQKRVQVAAAQKLRRKERRKKASQGCGRRFSQEGELLPMLPTRVCIRFAFDGWRRRELMVMSSAESGFECWCTVPPGEQQFIFEGVFPEDGIIKHGQQPRWRALRPVSPRTAKLLLSKKCGGESLGRIDSTTARFTQLSPCDTHYPHEVRPLQRYGGAGVGGALASVLADAASRAVRSARAAAIDDAGGAFDALPALAHCVVFPRRGGSVSGIVAWCCHTDDTNCSIANVTQEGMEELRGFPRPKQPARPKPGKPRKPWKFCDSIFAKFKDDTEDVLNRAFEYDWGQCGLPKMVEKRIAKRSGNRGPEPRRGESQLSPGVLAVKQALRKLYPVIKDAFRHYATYSNEVHTMAWNAFTDFTVACGVTDGAGGASGHRCDRAATDMIFMSCCTAGPRAKYNPKRSLVRWQFMETVARIAMEKYGEEHGDADLDKHLVNGPNLELSAVERMLHSDVEPNAERDSGSAWRHFRLWNEECDAEFRAREVQLQKLFDKYKGTQQQTIGKATKLSLDEWRLLCEQVGALDDSFTERELRLCFVYSAQTRTDEFTKNRHIDREFVEFVECVARFAEVKDLRRCVPEVRHGPFEGPLHLKIKAALDLLLRPLRKGFIPLSIKNRKRSVDQTTNTSSANSKRKASAAAAKVMNALRLSHAAD